MTEQKKNSFNSKSELQVGGSTVSYYRLDVVKDAGFPDPARLPISLRILLENLLRHEDGHLVRRADIEAIANWDAKKKSNSEIAFTPARVILQDFTGVPAVVDFAAMRDAMKAMGGRADAINPLSPADLVIDHSVQVDSFGTAKSLEENIRLEFDRNKERYQFLKWGQNAFRDFRVVPPGMGIVHQVNLEFLAQVVQERGGVAYPDTLVGTDSHTTMINGLGVLGWGVGGIEAEAAMLGQPISMLIPEVIGFNLHGALPAGATATDCVLTITQILRQKGVVGKFVEFFGDGLDSLSLPDRATIANMAPEYGATMGFFPVDEETIAYLRLSGRGEKSVQRTEAYLKAQGLFRDKNAPVPEYSDTLELDLGSIQPSLAGPKRPQDRVLLTEAKSSFSKELPNLSKNGTPELGDPSVLGHGSVVIAAITSCTNTSNPSVMLGAGLLAKKAVERGLNVKPWVKTSLAPGSKVVTDYLKQSGLLSSLEALKFNLVGYGCTTCIGNSGPLPEAIGNEVKDKDLIACSVLSGNRNFEGRVNPLVRANYLASPPLVVAYALAGSLNIDLTTEPLGEGSDGKPVYLKEIWPTSDEIREAQKSVTSDMYESEYAKAFDGEADWQAIQVPTGETYAWEKDSTYIKNPPFFENMPKNPDPIKDIQNARVLVMVGDSVTTDHISPAGSIAQDSPAGKYLVEKGVDAKHFNSYGSRRGNFEVMSRGTFANIRLKNQLAPGTEGSWTRHFPSNEKTSIFDASEQYQKDGVSLIVLAGKEYGTGSSRDWAAKGPALLGIKAAIAESYERIHRSNLIGMGILPLQFQLGESRESLGLTGEETYDIGGLTADLKPGKVLEVIAKGADGEKKFSAVCRIDTPAELSYYEHGGILQYVIRELLKRG